MKGLWRGPDFSALAVVVAGVDIVPVSSPFVAGLQVVRVLLLPELTAVVFGFLAEVCVQQCASAHNRAVDSCNTNGEVVLTRSSYDREAPLKIWDLQGSYKRHIHVTSDWNSRPICCCLSLHHVATGNMDNVLRLYELCSGKLVHTLLGHTGRISVLAFCRQGTCLLSGSIDCTVKLWDTAAGVNLHTLRGHASRLSCGCFSEDGNTVISGSYDKSLRVWDVKTGQVLQTYGGHSRPVKGCCPSIAGTQVVSWGWAPQYGEAPDSTPQLWSSATGLLLYNLEGHSGHITKCVFSHSGLVLSASSDLTLKLWDASSGRLLHTLEGHTSYVDSCGFLSGSKDMIAVSGSDDRTICVWNVESGHLKQSLEVGAYVHSFCTHDKTIISAQGNGTLKFWA
jgi:WD40 repeat protein